MLEPKIWVRTPENIEIEYSLAGIGSRGLAMMVDTLIQAAAVIILLLIALIAGSFLADLGELFDSRIIESIPIWVMGALVAIIYLIRVGYFTFFETIWSGQTPGKRFLKIRVVKEGGYPIGFIESMIRNLLRIVDILPGLYGVGLVSIFVSPKEKRVGDYVAGTVVVKGKIERMPSPEESKLPPLEKQSIDFGRSITKVSEQEYTVIKNFLQRRFGLDPASRFRLAGKIALPLIEKLGLARPLNVSYEVFLIHLLHAYEENAEFI